MITRLQRIPRQDFSQFSHSRIQVRGTYHTVVYSISPTNRGAVVVSKKVAKKAVDRNRLRRRAYATLAAFWAAETVPGAYIVYYKSGVLSASRAVLRTELLDLLARIPKSR